MDRLKTSVFWVSLSLILSLGQLAQADDLQIEVNEVPVYAQPQEDAEIISTLFRGDVVPVSSKSPPRYKKVLLVEGKRRRIGYVKNSDLRPGAGRGQGAKVIKRSKRKIKTVQDKNMIALTAGGNFQYQGGRTRTSADGNSSISAMSGISYIFGLSYDFPLGSQTSLSANVHYKNVSLTGTSKYALTAIPNQDTDTFLKQQFLGIGGVLKMYPSFQSSWWWGGGIQYDKAISGTLKYGGFNEITLQGSELPSFMYVFGAIGANFPLGASLFLNAEIRAGALLIASPMIYEADALLSLGYVF